MRKVMVWKGLKSAKSLSISVYSTRTRQVVDIDGLVKYMKYMGEGG